MPSRPDAGDAADDASSLDRFVDAQRGRYEVALGELRAGRKESHWIWFIFPQIHGLGASEVAQLFAIADLVEAVAYLAHPVLGPRLVTCVEALRAHRGTPVQHILGDLDALKLRSSLTLFARAHGGDGGVFAVALDEVCGGVRDARTEAILTAG